jgi:hypothetical protein
MALHLEAAAEAVNVVGEVGDLGAAGKTGTSAKVGEITIFMRYSISIKPSCSLNRLPTQRSQKGDPDEERTA